MQGRSSRTVARRCLGRCHIQVILLKVVSQCKHACRNVNDGFHLTLLCVSYNQNSLHIKFFSFIRRLRGYLRVTRAREREDIILPNNSSYNVQISTLNIILGLERNLQTNLSI